MKKVVVIISASVVIFVLITSALSASMSEETPNHTEWIAKILKDIQTIKVGTSRKQLLEKFTTEGGLFSRTWRTYGYRECPLIKVNVEFEPVGAPEEKHKESHDDKIIKISKPYLEETILD
jgi:hypothetical protein